MRRLEAMYDARHRRGVGVLLGGEEGAGSMRREGTGVMKGLRTGFGAGVDAKHHGVVELRVTDAVLLGRTDLLESQIRTIRSKKNAGYEGVRVHLCNWDGMRTW